MITVILREENERDIKLDHIPMDDVKSVDIINFLGKTYVMRTLTAEGVIFEHATVLTLD